MVDADGLLVEDNIIHGTVDGGIRIKSTGLSLRRNLVSFAMARACYQDRLEADNFFFHGSIVDDRQSNLPPVFYLRMTETAGRSNLLRLS